MKGIPYTLFPPAERLQRIVEANAHVFTPASLGAQRLMVPPGWVDILGLAVTEAAVHPEKWVQVGALWVQQGTLVAAYTAGTHAAKAAFMHTLQEARFYCPCCGGILPEQRSMGVWGE